jgi:hypothetical protein
MRKVLPITLILSLAAFGCTMNHNPGSGQPLSATPSMSPATTPGSSYGNVPMASSYTVPTNSNRLAADEAAATMREHQAYKGRVLGYLNPTPVIQQPGQQYETAQVASSPVYANPEVTVNSSSNSSQPTRVSTSAPATVTPHTVVAPTSYAPTVIPASTPNGSPITISNSDGQIVVSNVKGQ